MRMDIEYLYSLKTIEPDEALRLAGPGGAAHSDADYCPDRMEPLRVVLDASGAVLEGTDALRHIAGVGRPMECAIYEPKPIAAPKPKAKGKPRERFVPKPKEKPVMPDVDSDSDDYAFKELVAAVDAHLGLKGQKNMAGLGRNIARGLKYGMEDMFDQSKTVTIREALDAIDRAGADSLRADMSAAKRIHKADPSTPIAPTAAAIAVARIEGMADPAAAGIAAVRARG